MTTNIPKAVIADDEGELRTYLTKLLHEVWPVLVICAEAGNGIAALDAINTEKPQVAFLDIRMPGISGMQVAEKMVHHCHIVFVTAYDEYAIEAFENEAVDYLLKPVTKDRLVKTVARLKKKLDEGSGPHLPSAKMMRMLMDRIAASADTAFLQWLRVQKGDSVQLVSVNDVIYFQAKDKYTSVITESDEYLIRKSIRELTAELDPNCFCQIHRSTIVNFSQIATVSRSLTGRGVIRLRNRSESLIVSRPYLNLFKQM